MYTFTPTDVVTKVREIAAANPDRVYTSPGVDGSCFYIERDLEGKLCPSCLLGHAFVALGVLAASLIDAGDDGDNVHALLPRLIDFDETRDSASLRWLSFVQDLQDCGRPWAQAVDDADQTMSQEGR